MRNKLLLLALGFIIVLFSCGRPDKTNIKVVGSTTVFPIALVCAVDYMNLNPDINVRVRGGGSGAGLKSLIRGECDIATTSRIAKESEKKAAMDKGVKLMTKMIAMDGIVIVVHPSNPVNKLNIAQLRDIYNGKIKNWSGVGGANIPIKMYSRTTVSGTYEMVKEMVMEGDDFRNDATILHSNNEIMQAVQDAPAGIGYIGIGFLQKGVKPLKIDGVLPTKDSVKTGSYVLSRGLYLYTNGKPKGTIEDFIDYVVSDEGQKKVERVGYIRIY